MIGRLLFSFVLVLPVMLAAQPIAAQNNAAQPPSFANLAGEKCVLSARTDILPDPSAPPPADLMCGGANHASGAISLTALPLSLPTDPAQRQAALVKVASLTPARRAAGSKMACREGHWTSLGKDHPVYVEPCTLVDGDWYYLQLTYERDHFLVQLEGLPVNLPALAAASERLAGNPEPDKDLTSPDNALALVAEVFGEKNGLASSRELDSFSELTRNARLANSRRDDRGAEDYFRQALLILERAQAKDAPGVGKILSELALEISNQGRSEEAATLFRRAEPILQHSPNPADLARFNGYLAFDAGNDGRYEEGLAFARAATAEWRDLAGSEGPNLENLGEDARALWRGELAHSLNTQAAMALRTGDLAEAESCAKEALEIVGDSRNLPPWWKPELLVTLGRVHAALGRLNEAETSFRGALVYQQRLFGNTAPTASTLLALSGVYADEGLYEDSLRAYEFALLILANDDIARGQVQIDQVAALVSSAGAIGESKPERRAEMNSKIFEGVQLLSAGVADQTIAQASLRLAAQNPQMSTLVHDLQESERLRDTARVALAHETSLPDEQRGALKEKALLAEIAEKTALHDTLLKKLSTDYPAYAKLSHPQAVPLAELQSQLRPGEAVVMFELGRSKSFAVVVTKDQLTSRKIEINQVQAATSVRSLRKAFAAKGGRLADFDLVQSHALYKALFAPIEPALAGIDQLILVQSGALASLPASLLVTEAPGRDADYRRAAWLARKYSSFDVPSVRAFTDLRARAGTGKAAGQAFFGIGNPAFVGEGGESPTSRSALASIDAVCRDSGPFPSELLRRLEPLPDTATELRTVARAFGADDQSLLLGAAATETAFRKTNLADARVIYFATHALLPGELSCQSEPALALSPPASPATSRDQDGLLDASEVAAMTLNADLVVLSACNTGQTETKFGGQALSGLAESFFYAGARSLVASHWQVPSAATAKLMVGMFERLRDNGGGGTAKALQASQLALLERSDTAHPFFWAAFTIIGDSNAPGATSLSSMSPGTSK